MTLVIVFIFTLMEYVRYKYIKNMLEEEYSKFLIQEPFKKINGSNVKEQHSPVPILYLPLLRSASKRMEEARNAPKVKRLFSVIWQSKELHCCFSDTGCGKSILDMGQAIAFSRRDKYLGLENDHEPVKGLYYDLELSDAQFWKRYSSDNGEETKFNENLYIDNIDFTVLAEQMPKESIDEQLRRKFLFDIEQIRPEVLWIDNGTYLSTQSSQDTDVALKVMRLLNDLKKTYGLSICVFFHTPKRDQSRPITINHLAGSKHLANFSDSVSALGFSSQDKSIRYIKQLKPSRSAEIMYGEDNVITVELVKNGPTLTFERIGFCPETEHLAQVSSDHENEKKSKVLQLRKEGKSIREISQDLFMSKSAIGRIVKQGE
jgi:hypothetical protein